MTRTAADLTREKALIWRVVHRDNVPWILEHGLHCANGSVKDPNYVSIGKPDLIVDRSSRTVPIPPGGVLADYVPFYFTPFSPMVYNIVTGRGVRQRERGELCFVVSSLHLVSESGLKFAFADRHAYLSRAEFFSDLKDLDRLEWARWQARGFKRDPDDPLRFERYEAEALVHKHVPVTAVKGVVCYDSTIRNSIADQIASRSLGVRAVLRPEWYF